MTTTRGPAPATTACRAADAAAIAWQVSATDGATCTHATTPPSEPLNTSPIAPAVNQRLTGPLTAPRVRPGADLHTGRKARIGGRLVPSVGRLDRGRG